ncbi:MAG: hypothetical protein ACREDL_09325 [Bradyrhizobium sp.]
MPRRPTRDPYTRPSINTLERLHAELGGKILENKQQHAELAEQMRHVEAVIKMLDPSYSLRAISVKRRKGNQWFKRGTLYRKALDVLRTATEAMTATEIAAAVLKAEGVEDTSSKQLTILGQSIKASLRNHAGKGVMQTNEGIAAKWKLAAHQ